MRCGFELMEVTSDHDDCMHKSPLAAAQCLSIITVISEVDVREFTSRQTGSVCLACCVLVNEFADERVHAQVGAGAAMGRWSETKPSGQLFAVGYKCV